MRVVLCVYVFVDYLIAWFVACVCFMLLRVYVLVYLLVCVFVCAAVFYCLFVCCHAYLVTRSYTVIDLVVCLYVWFVVCLINHVFVRLVV